MIDPSTAPSEDDVGSEEVIGPAEAEVLEEDLVELVVVVLPRVHEHMVGRRVEALDRRATAG